MSVPWGAPGGVAEGTPHARALCTEATGREGRWAWAAVGSLGTGGGGGSLVRPLPSPRAYGVVSMCIGTGMGAAAVFEYPGN